MEIQEQTQGAVTVLRPMGALIDADAEAFKTKALAASSTNLGRIVVDSANVPYVDSRGIEALVDVTQELERSGRALKLCAANPTLRQVLDITGWADSFEFFDDVNGGVRSFL